MDSDFSRLPNLIGRKLERGNAWFPQLPLSWNSNGWISMLETRDWLNSQHQRIWLEDCHRAKIFDKSSIHYLLFFFTFDLTYSHKPIFFFFISPSLQSSEWSYLTYHKRIKLGFYSILCLPHSVVHLKRSIYARCSNSLLLHFYRIILSENIHVIRVYQVSYLLNFIIKMRSHH
jgi:hypothetical protein